RDLHGQGAPGPDTAFPGALRTGVRDDRAVALAARAGPGGHDLAEERPLDAAHLAPAVTGRAGGGPRPGRGAAAVARGADHGGLDLDLLDRPEHGVGELHLQRQQGVLATTGARTRTAGPRAAEERVHDVGEREPLGETAALAAARGERIAAEVVHLALLRVGEHLVRP